MKNCLTLFLLSITFQVIAQTYPIIGINISLPASPDANTVNWGSGTSMLSITATTKAENGRVAPHVVESKLLVTINKGGAKICGIYNGNSAPASGFNTPTKVWNGNNAVSFLGQDCVLPPGDYEIRVQFFGNGAAGVVPLSEEKTKTFSIRATEQQTNPIGPISISLLASPDANTANWGSGTSILTITATTKAENGKVAPHVMESKLLVTIKKNSAKICGTYTATSAPESNFNTLIKVWSGSNAVSFLGQDCVLPPGDYEICVQFFGNGAVGMAPLSEEKCKPFSIRECDCKEINWDVTQKIAYKDGKRGNSQLVKCSGELDTKVLAGSIIEYNASPYICRPGNCNVKYEWKILNVSSGAVLSTGITTNLPINFLVPATAGNYHLVVSPVCGTKTCATCGFYFSTTQIEDGPCKNFKVNFVKNTNPGQRDACCYDVIITNNNNVSSSFSPKSFRITSHNSSIISASGAPVGWNKTPSTTPPNTNVLAWGKASGNIPTGQTNLSTICFGNVIVDPFYLIYEWLDVRGKVICKDSAKIGCSDTGNSRPLCGKFAIALYNGVSSTQFSKVRITPATGSKLINAMVGDPDEDGDVEWNQTVGTNFSFVEWNFIGSTMPFNLLNYMDEEMYIWMDPTIVADQAIQIDWYDAANVIIASQKIFLPGSGDPANIYSESYNWEAHTTILSGASLNVFAGAAPEDCQQDRADRSDDCGNIIIHAVTCVGNKPTLTFSCNPLVDGESGMNWNLTNPNGSTITPANNTELTSSGDYTLYLTINHTSVIDNSDPNNPIDNTPADCDYETTFHVSIPGPVISEPVVTSSRPDDNGTCKFLVEFNALQSTNVTNTNSYAWEITGPETYSSTGESFSHLFTNPGTYYAKLTITDDYGCKHFVTRPFILTYACIPKFTWGTYDWCKVNKPPHPTENIPIQFTNTSQGGKCPQSYNWDFGDPSSNSNTSQSSTTEWHTFEVPVTGKTYTVKLTMTDANNCNTYYKLNIRIEPYDVDFTFESCPDGKVHFKTTNENPVWTFPGNNNPVTTWVQQHVFGLFGWYNNSDPVMSYETGDYTASLKATNNITHASCTISKQFHVEKICCNWKVKDHTKVYNTIGGKDYRMWVFWKWKVKKFHPLGFINTKIKVNNRVAKKYSKRYGWYRRVLVQSIYAGIEGTYYIKDPNDVCECITPVVQQDTRKTHSNRGKCVYRPGINETRNIREQSMKAKFGITVAGTPWDVWVYFTPCH